MFGARPKKPADPPRSIELTRGRSATPGEVGIPDVPSLEGYTIDELRAEQLARAIPLEELRPEQVALLIRTFTRGQR
jgi:hypothetical protein